MPMTGAISGSSHPKIRLSQIPLLDEKSGSSHIFHNFFKSVFNRVGNISLQKKDIWVVSIYWNKVSEATLFQYILHLIVGRPYQIVWNLKKVLPILQTLCSLAYWNIISQEYQVN